MWKPWCVVYYIYIHIGSNSCYGCALQYFVSIMQTVMLFIFLLQLKIVVDILDKPHTFV